MSAERRQSASSTRDIWQLLSTPAEPKKPDDSAASDAKASDPSAASAAEERESFVLLCGSKSAGKSTLISTYRSSKSDDAKPTPTTALDYAFVRTKDRPVVAHMWELATAKCIPEMMRVVLTPARILESAAVIVLDLSALGDVVPYLVKWLLTLYRVVQDVLSSSEMDPASVERLRREALARYSAEHADRDDVTPLAIPLLIIGNKYEAFRDEDSVKRKALLQALRFLAHQYGASLLLTSMKDAKDKNMAAQYRTVMRSFTFRVASGIKGTREMDPNKPIFVPAGSDSFSEIGQPTNTTAARLPRSQHEDRARQWKKHISEHYPASGLVSDAFDDGKKEGEIESKTSDEVSSSAADAWSEPSIDRVRARKTEELRRYREARRQQLLDGGKSQAKAAA